MTPETYLKIGIASFVMFGIFQLLWLSSREDKELNTSLAFLIAGFVSLFAWFIRIVS